jgi:hypothetical protein
MGVLRYILLIPLALLSHFSLASDAFQTVSASLTNNIGQNLSPEDPQTSFTFEPEIIFHLGSSTDLSLSSAIDRPTDPYKNFSVPKTIAALHQKIELTDFAETKLILSENAINLDRWAADGHSLRTSLGLQAEKELLTNLTLITRVGPYIQANKYTQNTEGKDLARYGLSEKIHLKYVLGDFLFEAALVLDQRMTSAWYNDYATLEAISYQLSELVSFGISHELLGSFIEPSTGFSKRLEFFHERDSRLSAFVTLSL